MITGALAGLLVAIVFTLVTGKLQLTKNRIVYDTPARIIALVSLLPVLGLVAYMLATKTTVNQPGGMGLFVLALVSSVVLMYAIGWRLGEMPRR